MIIDTLALGLVLVILNILNLILQCTGAFLLISVFKNNHETVEMVYLINLSITGLIANIVILLEECTYLISKSIGISPNHKIIFEDITHYFHITTYVIFCAYYMQMIYITLDRLLVVLLNLRYPLYWNEMKSRKLLAATWLVAIVTSVSISIAHGQAGLDHQFIFIHYISPIYNIVFVVFSVGTYSYLFHQFRLTRMKPTTSANNALEKAQKESTWQIFRKSRFYVSVLLVISFLLFMVIPNVITVFQRWALNRKSPAAIHFLKIFHQLLFLSNGTIYVLLQPNVRKILWRKLRVNKLTQLAIRWHANHKTMHQNPSEVANGITLLETKCEISEREEIETCEKIV